VLRFGDPFAEIRVVSFSNGTIALASKLKGTSCLSAIAATWRLWDEKKVEVCPYLYISHGLAEELT
jgi:hypothetical protein